MISYLKNVALSLANHYNKTVSIYTGYYFSIYKTNYKYTKPFCRTARGDRVNFNVLTEPDLSGNFWNAKYMAGMRAAVRECKGNLSELKPCDLEKIAAEENGLGARIPVILNGRTPDWFASHIAYAMDRGFHPILLGSYNNTALRGVSALSFDFYGIYTAWCSYMYQHGWRNIALVGVSTDNMSDAVKQEAFCDYNNRHNAEGNTGIYYVENSLQNCCESFLADAEQYDAVLCTNDVVAIVLVSLLRQKGFLDSLHVHSFWDSPLTEYLHPEIKMISLDYHEMGRQAIRLYSFLVNNPGIESVSATVRGAPFLMQEKGNISHVSACENRFLRDEWAQEIYALERLFSVLDEIDLRIICSMVESVPYEQIAEKEFIAVGTVKYRVKRMLSVSQKSSREELLALIDKYLDTEDFISLARTLG